MAGRPLLAQVSCGYHVNRLNYVRRQVISECCWILIRDFVTSLMHFGVEQ